jgi:very-short-patch-repair endonuclease
MRQHLRSDKFLAWQDLRSSKLGMKNLLWHHLHSSKLGVAKPSRQQLGVATLTQR